jgi:hypothetical protein
MEHNTEARSQIHCCRKKAMSYIFTCICACERGRVCVCVCVSVSVGVGARALSCACARIALLIHALPYYHPQPLWLHHIVRY